MDNTCLLYTSGKKLFDIYFTIGVIAMALLAALVIFTVIARYCFSLSWKQLAEFNTTPVSYTHLDVYKRQRWACCT